MLNQTTSKMPVTLSDTVNLQVSSKKIAILGGGSSAGYVALACKDLNITPDLYYNTFGAPPVGAFWYYWLPEWFIDKYNLSRHRVIMRGSGFTQNYILKQWGTDLDMAKALKESSFPRITRIEYGYNPTHVFGRFFADVNLCHVKKFLSDFDISEIAKDYDMVFMTFPTRPSIDCQKKYLVKRACCIAPEAIGQMLCTVLSPSLDIHSYDQNVVVYDGLPQTTIVRVSKLFSSDYRIEFASDSELPSNLSAGVELSTFVDSWPNTSTWDLNATPAKNVYLIGRLAQWDRHMLAHESYNRARDLILGVIDE